ncbi:MAG: hypothetical protein Ct9H300mP28_21940 [Pseudomonadota bacterium]|nr:MAG: hypothetical protein Ct9H300mP28_21940 [Pseudomonadota bacterium]
MMKKQVSLLTREKLYAGVASYNHPVDIRTLPDTLSRATSLSAEMHHKDKIMTQHWKATSRNQDVWKKEDEEIMEQVFWGRYQRVLSLPVKGEERGT